LKGADSQKAGRVLVTRALRPFSEKGDILPKNRSKKEQLYYKFSQPLEKVYFLLPNHDSKGD
jgi:hypothetical protein